MEGYININHALEFVAEKEKEYPCFTTDFKGMYMFIKDELPRCEEPKGAWIYDEDYRPRCNVCGTYQQKLSTFCPSCGVKMNYPKEYFDEDKE
jgi:hypothetical protein